jgi:hypothetical protein
MLLIIVFIRYMSSQENLFSDLNSFVTRFLKLRKRIDLDKLVVMLTKLSSPTLKEMF